MSAVLAAADATPFTSTPVPPRACVSRSCNEGQPALAVDTMLKAAPRLYPTWVELIGAAARQSNSIVSVFSNNMNYVDPYEIEKGFDFQKEARDAGHEGDGYLDRYAYVFNQRAADALTAQTNKE